MRLQSRLSDKGRLIGIDQDEDAIKAASERLKFYGQSHYCKEQLLQYG